MQFEDVAEAAGTSAAQREKLQAVDGALEEMSKSERADLWAEAALRSDPAWARVRSLAKDALDAFGRAPGLPDASRLHFLAH